MKTIISTMIVATLIGMAAPPAMANPLKGKPVGAYFTATVDSPSRDSKPSYGSYLLVEIKGDWVLVERAVNADTSTAKSWKETCKPFKAALKLYRKHKVTKYIKPAKGKKKRVEPYIAFQWLPIRLFREIRTSNLRCK